MEKTYLEIENDKNAIALFKYGIIAPLINDIHSFKSKEEFFREAASKQYTLFLLMEKKFKLILFN